MPGRKGYVLKGVGSKMLAEILQSVAGGETYVSPALAARMLMSLKELNARASPANPLSRLTQRERQILESVASGLSNKEVAIRLDLQEKTVKHHMTRIMAKLGVRNRTEAAMLLHGAGSPAAQREKGGRGPLLGFAEARSSTARARRAARCRRRSPGARRWCAQPHPSTHSDRSRPLP